MNTWTLMDLLAPTLAEEGLSDADLDELTFHVAEILADVVPLARLLSHGEAPAPAVVRELISQVIWHWPYHQKGVARLEERMNAGVLGRGTFKPRNAKKRKAT
jgi:hypothetical protein